MTPHNLNKVFFLMLCGFLLGIVYFESSLQRNIARQFLPAEQGGLFRLPEISVEFKEDLLPLSHRSKNFPQIIEEKTLLISGLPIGAPTKPINKLWERVRSNQFNEVTEITPEEEGYKKILVWHYAYGDKRMGFGFGHAPFEVAGCKESKCIVTANRTLIPVQDFDAVIMQLRSLTKESMPKKRSPHQRWIFFEMESASYIYQHVHTYNGLFNWTMTYKHNSDIWSKYGRVIPVSSYEQKIRSSRSKKSKLPNWQTRSYNSSRNYAEGKTKMAAWFVSNCFAISHREKYAHDLRKFLKLDIYGTCGRLTCPRENSDLCFDMLQRDYKFYLSFENSLCPDYVTEKFFNILRYDIIPVVYGLGNYKEIAPPHSYIDALRFKTINKLAKYLIYLSKNDTAYNEYFKWKGKYDIHTRWTSIAMNFCDLCKKLHEKDQQPKVYEDMEDWFVKNGSCKTLQSSSWLDWFIMF